MGYFLIMAKLNSNENRISTIGSFEKATISRVSQTGWSVKIDSCKNQPEVNWVDLCLHLLTCVHFCKGHELSHVFEIHVVVRSKHCVRSTVNRKFEFKQAIEFTFVTQYVLSIHSMQNLFVTYSLCPLLFISSFGTISRVWRGTVCRKFEF